MNKNYEVVALFKELSLENQETLLACARVSQAAENAVKEAFAGWREPETVNGGEKERAVCRGQYSTIGR
jgi:hypothetical protein